MRSGMIDLAMPCCSVLKAAVRGRPTEIAHVVDCAHTCSIGFVVPSKHCFQFYQRFSSIGSIAVKFSLWHIQRNQDHLVDIVLSIFVSYFRRERR